MQTSNKTRSCPANRATKTSGSESDSNNSVRPSRTFTDRSPKANVHRRSSKSPVTENKRSSRVSELELQFAQLQEEVKKTKDQLNSSESWKRKAQHEAEETKKQLMTVSVQLEDKEQQLVEFSAAEEDRLQELRKISLDRDRAWQSELEVVQKQHSMDSTALASALNEIQRLKMQLDIVIKSEVAKNSEIQMLKQEMESLRAISSETEQLLSMKELELEESNAQVMKMSVKYDEIEQLKVALDEQQIQNTLQIHSLHELVERMKIECEQMGLMEDVTELKAKVMDKETELQSIAEENKEMKQELSIAQAVNAEMEVELRRIRVQSEQWRKAAEAAAAVLMTGNDGGFMEIVGNPMSSPSEYDELSDESPKKKNSNNMLKKIGWLLKKGSK